jgi:hypothetical protein
VSGAAGGDAEREVASEVIRLLADVELWARVPFAIGRDGALTTMPAHSPSVRPSTFTPLTGAAEEIVSYTPFMLYVCGVQNVCSEGEISLESQGESLVKGWADLNGAAKEELVHASKTERIRRRLQRIYAKSWDESAKETSAASVATPPEVTSKLREIDSQQRSREEKQVLKLARKAASKQEKKSKSLQKPKTLTAFQIFFQTKKVALRQVPVKYSGPELEKIAHDQWQNMSAEERKPFLSKARLSKKRLASSAESVGGEPNESSSPHLGSPKGAMKRSRSTTPTMKKEMKKARKSSPGIAAQDDGGRTPAKSRRSHAALSIASLSEGQAESSYLVLMEDARIKDASESGDSIILASTTQLTRTERADSDITNDEFAEYLSLANYGRRLDAIV